MLIIRISLVFLFIISIKSGLESVIKNDPDHVFPLTKYKDFTKYFKKTKGNPHRVLLIVVGESMKAQCPYCGVFAEQFRFIAKHYYEVYKTSIIFSILEYEESEELTKIVRDLQIQTVPTIFVYPKGQSLPGSLCPIQNVPVYECIKNHLGVDPPESLKGFIGEQKRQGQQGGGPGQGGQGRGQGKTSSNYYIFLFFAISIGLFLLYFTYQIFKPNLGRFLVFFFLLIIFIFCCGCTVYNMIQNPGPNYGKSIIYPQQRVQMRYEGYVAAYIIVLFTLSWIACSEYYSKSKEITVFIDESIKVKPNKFEDTDEPDWNKLLRKSYEKQIKKEKEKFLLNASFWQKKKKKIISYLFIILVFSMFIACLHMYIQKYRWYLNDVPYFNQFIESVGNLPIKSLFEWYST